MTTTVNGFRYGEISRKQAGRYAEDGYQQGCFQFKNAMTMYDTGMTRRYPLRTLTACEETIYTIHPFRLSDTENFILGFGVNSTGDNVINIYEWNGTSLTLVTQLDSNVDKLFQSMIRTYSGDKYTEVYSNVTLNEEICQNMRFAQYYNRMYVCSSKFLTMYIEYSGTKWQAAILSIVGNDNAKGNIYFLKDGSAEDGTVVFKWNGEYYKDVEHTEKYTGSKDSLKPADNSYISSYDDYVASDDLNTTVGTYPSVIAIINDSLYLANTENKPSTIWKSRTIGSSQWIEETDIQGNPIPYSVQTLSDFTQFQVVATEETKLKDSEDWPKTQETGYYETENAVETWYAPTKTDGDYDYKYKLKRTQQYWLTNGRGKLWYTSQTYTDENQKKFTSGSVISEYEKDFDGTVSSRVIYKYDGTQVYPQPDEGDAKEYDPTKDKSETGGGSVQASDYIWTYAETTDEHKEGDAYSVDDTLATNPINKPLFTYNLTNADDLYETSTTVDLVSTDSCGVRMELNTGADDAVRFITAGCGKIIVGTSTCEKTLPADFNAVSNMYSSHYSDYGSLFIEPIKLGRSFFFFQTGRKIRELYLSDGYMEDADVTALNHDIFDHPIVDTVGKNTPDPSLFSVLDNGTIVQITYDRNGGLNSFARWDNDEYFNFKSLADTHRDDKETLLTLIEMKDTGKRYICYFKEPTDEEMGKEIYYDEIDGKPCGYETKIETVYAEVYDGSSVFGRFKKAKTMYIRPYHCGRIKIGNDERQMNTTNKALEDSDFNLNLAGSMEKNFSIKIKSVDSEAMTILALAWEA